MGDKRATPTAVKQLSRWIRSRSVRQQVSLASISALILLILMKVFIRNYTYFYVAAQLAHSIGILVLIYKLTITKTCSGLSLKTQELTAVFLFMRIICHFEHIRDVYIVLDSLTLVCTLWMIYMIRFKLKSTYMQELDNMPLYYVLVPCAVVGLIGNPGIGFIGLFYMYCKSVEAVSVLPQLQLIQNAKLIDTKGGLLTEIGRGHLYILLTLIAEVVQTFILADFCYYYVKSVMDGQRLMRLPSLV
ncbi:ER lumen protein-retaining receptor A isoform X2 [Beta vulgaris subsp. vulgaris]|uniref:ER lumen protein-retaining receptor A isoform X2 n=1 Tax=Beta vulgaris subsp. vulgaris TaxID=3555 RepID=UPI002546A7AF|nr:ER lumen protein-retaining receptor A isoform X2 [Beta vulgaris subsp. vulgaris]